MKTNLLLSIFFALAAGNIFAQPTNDECWNGEMLTVYSSCYPVTRSTTGAAINTLTGCVGNADDDVWFVFNFSAYTQYTITVDGYSGFDAVVELLNNCGTSIECKDATGDNGIETITYTTGGSVGTRHIRVYHYYAGSGSGSFDICVYTGSTPTPNISSISPDPVPCSNSQQTITLWGSDFTSGCQVTLWDVTNNDGPYVKSTTFINSSQIQLSANFTANAATWSAQVTSPASSNTLQFQVCSGGTAPTITNISPDPVQGSNSQQTITLYGSDFTSGCQVTLWDVTNNDGPYVKSTTFINSSQIQLSANFTNNTATWSAQVTSPISSNTYQFDVVVSCTPPSDPTPTFGNSTCTNGGQQTVNPFTLTWSNVSADGYKVFISEYPFGSGSDYSGCLSNSITSYQVTGLYPGKLFRWSPAAYNGSNCPSSCINPGNPVKYFYIPPIIMTGGSMTFCYGNSVGLSTPDYTVGSPGSLSYQWYKDGSPISGATSTVITANQTGNYTVRLTYSGSTECSGTITIESDPETVTVYPPPSVTTSSTNATCGQSNGTATAFGGSTYQWGANAGNQTSQTANGLSAGNYSVTVTNANGCTATATVSVNNVGAPIISTSATNATGGNCNGTASVTASGGIQPYSYQWSNSATTANVSGLCAGNYSVTVTDGSNCQAVSSVTISQLVGINEDVNDFHFNIFPNPTDGNFTIQFSGVSMENVEIKVLNLLGETVYSEQVKNSMSNDFSQIGIDAGVYIVQIKVGNKIYRKKLLIE